MKGLKFPSQDIHGYSSDKNRVVRGHYNDKTGYSLDKNLVVRG